MNYRTARTIQIILVILIIVIAVAGLISVARVVFVSKSSSVGDTSGQALVSTSADRAVQMTVRGKIVADENYRSYVIKITPNTRALDTYEGYIERKVEGVELYNNIPSYEQFVYALNRAGMVRGPELIGDANDTRGICANGYVYEFQVAKADKPIKTLWTSTCSNAKGSLSASYSSLKSLFIAQIPGSQSIISKLWQ